MDAVRVNRNIFPYTMNVRDSGRSKFVGSIQFENPILEIGWILGISLPPGSIESWNLVGFSVFLRQMLNSVRINLELACGALSVHVLIHNRLHCMVDINLFQLHLPWSLRGDRTGVSLTYSRASKRDFLIYRGVRLRVPGNYGLLTTKFHACVFSNSSPPRTLHIRMKVRIHITKTRMGMMRT